MSIRAGRSGTPPGRSRLVRWVVLQRARRVTLLEILGFLLLFVLTLVLLFALETAALLSLSAQKHGAGTVARLIGVLVFGVAGVVQLAFVVGLGRRLYFLVRPPRDQETGGRRL